MAQIEEEVVIWVERSIQIRIGRHLRIVSIHIGIRAALDNDAIDADVGCEIKDLSTGGITYSNCYSQCSVGERATLDWFYFELCGARKKLLTTGVSGHNHRRHAGCLCKCTGKNKTDQCED